MSTPRYVPERPLPPYAFLPGRDPHPTRDPAGHSYRIGDAHDPHAFPWGVDLYNHGFYWEAHEAWEPLWRDSVVGGERAFLQGLIQCAAAALKARAGAWDVAQSIAQRAAAHLARAGGDPVMGVDVSALMDGIRRYVRTCDPSSRPPRIELG